MISIYIYIHNTTLYMPPFFYLFKCIVLCRYLGAPLHLRTAGIETSRTHMGQFRQKKLRLRLRASSRLRLVRRQSRMRLRKRHRRRRR